MEGIENLAEGEAFMNAADDILGLNHPLRDVEIARLRQAWIAGRRYALEAIAGERAAAGEVGRLREALQNAVRELVMWHKTNPCSQELQPYCVTCGYIADARAALRAATTTEPGAGA